MAKILLARYFGKEMPLDVRQVDTKHGEYLTELRESGFLDFVPCEPPTEQPGKTVVESYKVIDGKLEQSWIVQDLPEDDAG